MNNNNLLDALSRSGVLTRIRPLLVANTKLLP